MSLEKKVYGELGIAGTKPEGAKVTYATELVRDYRYDDEI